jgi:YHS domain-containing protein
MKINLFFIITLTLLLSCTSESVKDAPKIDDKTEVSDEILKKLAYCNGAWQGDTDLEKLEYSEKQKREYEWREKLNENENKIAPSLVYQLTNKVDQILASRGNCNAYFDYKIIEYYAGIFMDKKKYKEAADIWEKYKSRFPQKKKDIEELISILLTPNDNIVIRNMGKKVNSTESDVVPLVELNGKEIYFCSERSGGSGGEDIWHTYFDDQKGEWVESKPVKELNSAGNDAALAISPDGTEMIIFINGQLYSSKLSAKGWQKPEALPSVINTQDFQADASYTADGKGLLFVSTRAGGPYNYTKRNKFYAGSSEGNIDIYISFKQEDGTYSSPVNLGSAINTPGAERTPYLHPNGKTLYFSSEGHNGFGNNDIYKSERLDDTWQKWSKPLNIGKSLNTSMSDWGFKVSPLGDKGYFSTYIVDNTIGGSDIYEILPLPPSASPSTSVVAIHGIVTDQNGKPLEASVKWKNEKDNKTGNLASKPTNGEFYVALPAGGKYQISVTKSGYSSTQGTIDLSSQTKFEEKSVKLVLNQIPESKTSDSASFAKREIITDFSKEIKNETLIVKRETPSQSDTTVASAKRGDLSGCKNISNIPVELITFCNDSHILVDIGSPENIKLYHFYLLKDEENIKTRERGYKYFIKNACPKDEKVHEYVTSRSKMSLFPQERALVYDLMTAYDRCSK